ncbi:DUF6415 family natural product biosynthesis protein [Streptomyces sp. NPDC051567]|uniref:DUF6415 family natural product biosynthesis protein n=1 Tax=Streptomyces sp. NPDC051567 TaxID=3365660 RepID=UPI00378C119A
MTGIRVHDASETTVLRVLEELRRPIGTPALNTIFEDLEAVLGPDSVPDEEEMRDLALRMRGHLTRLLAAAPEYAEHPEYEARPDEITGLVRAARGLLDAFAPVAVPSP